MNIKEIIKNSPNKRIKQIISAFDSNENIQNKYNSEVTNELLNLSVEQNIPNRKRNNSVHQTNLSFKRRFSHNKLNIFNYRKIRRRSIKMIRRNSDDICIFKNKQKLMLNLLTKNSKLNDSIIRQNTTENVNNLTNISYSEESASYFNNTLNMIDNDNNSNIFQNDISISRKDSDFNIANSEISKVDSVDGTRDDSQKYFLSSSNNNSFQLEYKRDNKKFTE